MPGPGATLREIHRLRRNVKDLDSRIEAGPRQLKMQHAAIARHEENLKKAQEELKLLKVHTHDKELSLKITSDQIKKYEKQLNDIMSKKEYDALKHEMATSREQAGKLEDVILAALEKLEEQQKKIPELEKALAQAKAQAAQFEHDHDSRMADLAQQRQQVLTQLAEIEATLPAEIRSTYDRLISFKGEDAMAAARDGNCVACYTAITAQNLTDLKRELFVVCKSCGRMLYAAE